MTLRNPSLLALDDVNALHDEAFVSFFGDVFEHSPWVARAAWSSRPFSNRGTLRDAMVAEVAAAPRERQLALIRAHPDLAGRAAVAGALTQASAREQSGAGLDRLTPDEHAALIRGNGAYTERFGFPFVVCVRGHTPATILASLEERLGNEREAEIAAALDEIAGIAGVRLEGLVE